MCSSDLLSTPPVLQKITGISVERFRDELMKLLKAQKPSIGIRLMAETGILKLFIPEFESCRGCIQNDDRGYHVFDVFDHNIYACDGSPIEKPLVRLAALFHDIGKPVVRNEHVDDGIKICNFYNHEVESEKITRAVMTRLKFSNAETDHVCHLIKHHMFHYTTDWSDAAIRRFLVKIGKENIDDLIDLRLADMYGKYNQPVRLHDSAACDLLVDLKDRIKAVEEKNQALSLKDLAVNGKDLIAIGIPAGKQLGAILNQLFEAVLEDPALNEKEKLLELAEKSSIFKLS